MTSPVDCMPGPSEGSTPRSLAVENTGALTATKRRLGQQSIGPAQLAQRGARRHARRQRDHGHAGDLGQERHRAAGARVDLEDVDAVVAHDELGVDQAAHADLEADAAHGVDDEALVGRRELLWREEGGAVARVDPGALDVLHEPGDEHVGAVGDGVDVDLQALEIGVDADGALLGDDGRHGQLSGQVVGAVAEVDGQAADDERRPHQHRVAELVGHRERLIERGGDAAARLGDAQRLDHVREAGALLGPVDGLHVDARQRHAGAPRARPPG